MSKYNALWQSIAKNKGDSVKLTFLKTEELAGVPLDHSFLNCKAELEQLGWRVKKISLKEKTVFFERIEEKPLGEKEE